MVPALLCWPVTCGARLLLWSPSNSALTLFQPLVNHTQDSAADVTQPSLNSDKLLQDSSTPLPPSQPQEPVNGPCSQPSGDGSLQTTSPADGVSKNDSGLKVPVPLRKSRPLSMDARIQVEEEKQIIDQAEHPSPAASRSQKASQSRPNSSALETLGGETLANGGLELPSSVTPGHSKRASDCSNLSTSESMDYGTSLSADLSLNKETGSLSLKVISPVTWAPRQARGPACHAQVPFSQAGRSCLLCISCVYL